MVEFWDLMSKARGTADPKAPSATPESLQPVLEALTNKQVVSFVEEFTGKLCELNSWRLWGAGYVIAGGMSDDSFHYFRSWIIGKGKALFDLAKADPDALGPFIDDPEVDNELLEYVGLEVLEARGIEDDPRDALDADPDADPEGEPFDEDTVEDLYPKLAAM
jgi:hypothetical protein